MELPFLGLVALGARGAAVLTLAAGQQDLLDQRLRAGEWDDTDECKSPLMSNSWFLGRGPRERRDVVAKVLDDFR